MLHPIEMGLIVLACGVPLTAQTAAPDHTIQDAVTTTRAIGTLLAREQTTYRLLDTCAQEFAMLQPVAIQGRQRWQAQHVELLAQARKLRAALPGKIDQEIDSLVDSHVRAINDKLASYPSSQRFRICERLINVINTGQWDISVVAPEAAAVVQRHAHTR